MSQLKGRMKRGPGIASGLCEGSESKLENKPGKCGCEEW